MSDVGLRMVVIAILSLALWPIAARAFDKAHDRVADPLVQDRILSMRNATILIAMVPAGACFGVGVLRRELVVVGVGVVTLAVLVRTYRRIRGRG
jgi:hypothetical protein